MVYSTIRILKKYFNDLHTKFDIYRIFFLMKRDYETNYLQIWFKDKSQ